MNTALKVYAIFTWLSVFLVGMRVFFPIPLHPLFAFNVATDLVLLGWFMWRHAAIREGT